MASEEAVYTDGGIIHIRHCIYEAGLQRVLRIIELLVGLSFSNVADIVIQRIIWSWKFLATHFLAHVTENRVLQQHVNLFWSDRVYITYKIQDDDIFYLKAGSFSHAQPFIRSPDDGQLKYKIFRWLNDINILLLFLITNYQHLIFMIISSFDFQ